MEVSAWFYDLTPVTHWKEAGWAPEWPWQSGNHKNLGPNCHWTPIIHQNYWVFGLFSSSGILVHHNFPGSKFSWRCFLCAVPLLHDGTLSCMRQPTSSWILGSVLLALRVKLQLDVDPCATSSVFPKISLRPLPDLAPYYPDMTPLLLGRTSSLPARHSYWLPSSSQNSMFPTFVRWHCKIDCSNIQSLRSNPYHFWHLLSHVWVINNAGSGLDEQVHLLLVRVTSNYM